MANENSRPAPFVRREGRPRLSGLTLICCCAGWGKTAFLRQLAQDNPQSVCVSLNTVDDSAESVLDMLGADNADGVLDELSGKGLLLVDNADSATSPDGCEILRRLAEAAAQGQITAVFAARRFPKYLLPFVVDGRAEVWGMKELRFTSEEACSLAAQLNPKLTESDVDCLNGFTGGWCVATAALLREGVRDVRAAADNSCLMEYIEGMILDELPDTLKKRFLQSALLQGDGCYRSFDADMGDKAMKIELVFSWDDIVLPEHSKRLLRDACCQVRCHHRVFDSWGFSARMPYGRGVSMIFTGPPGTGKTMAAQVMASELGMEIYKINLANVVSKYIGETEKNLNLIFEKARLCRCILFFDEADVLFSKRTEVKETNDKYSNMESAFLLQKIEEYNGTVILATNLVQNFDEAFKRRMRFIIDFPFPGAEQRREMWHRAFPAQTPVEYIDYDFIVERFEFSGSNIRNIALHSAFLAASDGSAGVGMKHLMEAILVIIQRYNKNIKIRTESRKGRIS